MPFTPRNVKDEVVQYPNRYRLIPVDENLYEIIPEPGAITELGTPINRAYLMPIEYRLVQSGKWELIQEYKTAGTYEWTVPDLYGDGRDYDIGVCVIGGGGSGAVGKYNSDEDRAYCQGGSSGYLKNAILRVTPGQTIPVVVGAGGAAVTLGSSTSKIGNNGGSSSFNGIVAEGGLGGGAKSSESSTTVSSKLGGQSSSGLFYTTESLPTPAMGSIPNGGAEYGTTFNCLNVFDGRRYLAAGGRAGTGLEYAVTLDDGGSSSGGKQGSSGPLIADKATSPGCGGGACSLFSRSSSEVVMSAAGADGAVMIYV